MAIAAIALLVLTWALVGVGRRRAISPRMAWRSCVAFGPFDEILARRCLATATSRFGAIAPSRFRGEAATTSRTAPGLAGWLTAGLGLVVLAVVAVAVLAASGHFPVDGISVLPTALAAGLFVVAAACVAALLVRSQLRRSPLGLSIHAHLVRRGPHGTVVAGLGEVALGLSTAVVTTVLAHTVGSPSPSIHEVVAISILARLVTMTPAPALGLGWADGVMIVGLTAIHTPVAVAIATTAVWRITQFAAITLGWITATKASGTTVAEDEESSAPTHSRLGQVAHRTGFALLALLPDRWSRWIRCRLFDAMFGMADDPWNYAQMPYERRKQEHLLAAMPAEASVILEIGCAGGHNLVALANRYPRNTIIGVDISARAVALARDRVRSHANVIVAVADFHGLDAVLAEHAGHVDALVLSEVLYYVGVASQLDHAMRPVRGILLAGASVVLVHGASDAERLHPAACRALGASQHDTMLVGDADRPFAITKATVLSRPGSN